MRAILNRLVWLRSGWRISVAIVASLIALACEGKPSGQMPAGDHTKNDRAQVIIEGIARLESKIEALQMEIEQARISQDTRRLADMAKTVDDSHERSVEKATDLVVSFVDSVGFEAKWERPIAEFRLWELFESVATGRLLDVESTLIVTSGNLFGDADSSGVSRFVEESAGRSEFMISELFEGGGIRGPGSSRFIDQWGWQCILRANGPAPLKEVLNREWLPDASRTLLVAVTKGAEVEPKVPEDWVASFERCRWESGDLFLFSMLLGECKYQRGPVPEMAESMVQDGLGTVIVSSEIREKMLEGAKHWGSIARTTLSRVLSLVQNGEFVDAREALRAWGQSITWLRPVNPMWPR